MTREELLDALGNAYLTETLDNYGLHGIPPGGFMKAVLTNNLFEAMRRADYWNKNNLHRIVGSIEKYLPIDAYGDMEKYHLWLNDVEGRRSKFAAAIKERRIIDKLQNSYMNHIRQQFPR